MNHFLRLSRILSSFKSFFCAEWKWQSPPKCDVLIYDQDGSEDVKNLFNRNCNIQVMPVRGESYNVKALVKSFTLTGLFKIDIQLPYIISYIKYSNPKLIITFIDNSVIFYKISSWVPNAKTALIQNGVRGGVANVFDNIKSNDFWCVDYMFLFGPGIGKIYSKFIEGEVIPVGSIKNNAVPRSISLKKSNFSKKVAFISQWRPDVLDGFFIKIKNYRITHEDFYSSERIVLDFLSGWCQDNGYEFAIIGAARERDKSDQERVFYKNIIKSEHSFLSPEKMLDSYFQLDRFHIICSIESTLAYESLARGNKTAIFSIRGPSLGVNSSHFGWPGHYSDTGPFWTNRAESAEFKKIMDYLRDVSDVQWESVRSDVMKNIMLYDPDNNMIKEYLHHIIK